MSAFALLWLFAPTTLDAQATFQKTYGGTEDDFGADLALTDDGYVVAGSTFSSGAGGRDALLMKIDFDGNVVWQRTYGGFDADQFNYVTAGNDGGFLAFGDTYSQGAGGRDVWLVKTDDAGNVVWTKTIGGAFDDSSPVQGKILRLSDGYVVSFVQQTTTQGGVLGATLVRLDNAGNQIWAKAYTAPESANLNVTSISASGLLLYGGGGAQGGGNLIHVETATGDLLFTRQYSGPGTEALYNVFPTLDSNLILSDHTWSASGGLFQSHWLMKTTVGGDILWSKAYTQTGFNLRGVAIPTADGGYFSTPYNQPLTVGSDAYMVKFDPNGGIEWSHCFGGDNADQFVKGYQTADGGYIAVGQSANTGAGGTDILLVKVNADGLLDECCKKELVLEVQDFEPEILDEGYVQDEFPGPQTAQIETDTFTLAAADFCSGTQPVLNDTIALCPGDTIHIGGNLFAAPATVTMLIPGEQGCDTVLILNLILKQYTEAQFDFALCPGGSVTINGVVYDQPGTFVDTLLANGLACDTVATYVITQQDLVMLSDTIDFCVGDTIFINGQPYTESGQAFDTIPAAGGGCDTLVTYNLFALPVPSITGEFYFCPGDTVTIYDQQYTQPGTVQVIFPSATGGCDTLATIELVLLQPDTTLVDVAFCAGDTVVIDGEAYTQPGSVTSILQNTAGCDSVVYYTLILLPTPELDATVFFCLGDTVFINGQAYTQPGSVTQTLPSATGGCDTLAHYFLIPLPQPTVSDTFAFCAGDAVVINGQTYTQPGIVTQFLPSADGSCDTLATYVLTLLPQPSATQVVTFCPGESVTIDGQVYDQPGVVFDTIPAATGCDTLVIYDLQFDSFTAVTQTIEFCPGESVVIDGQTYTQPGTVIDTIPSTTGGCDTLLTYNLQFSPTDLTITLDSFVCLNGSPVVYYTVCNLGSGPFPSNTWITFYGDNPFENATPPLGVFLDNVMLNDNCYSSSTGTFLDSIPSSNTLFAVVNDNGMTGTPYSLSDFPLAFLPECNYANNIEGIALFPQGNLDLDLGPDLVLCADTAYTFDAGSDFVDYLWQDGSTGNTFTATTPGVYSVRVKDACGFIQRDSVTLSYNLIADTQFPDQALCIGQSTAFVLPGFDAYAWSPATGLSCTDCGSVVAQPDATTTYTLLATTADGCSLADTFTITVLPLVTRDETIEFCPGESVVIDGQTYTQSAAVVDTLPALTGGCDTIVNYTLTLLTQPTLTQTIEFCPGESVTIGGQTYDQPGTVTLSIASTTGGCDTIAIYVLQYTTPSGPTAVSVACPASISVDAASGASSAAVSFAVPSASSDCPCPGIAVTQTQGLASGSNFPLGATQVCFAAADSCGNTASCCFTVAVNAVDTACDTKVIGCMKYEIIGLSKNADQERTCRIRVTNNCASKLVYLAVQLPNGVAAIEPANGSTYTSPTGRTYAVRNPSGSPFYSIRFKPTADSISGGESDVFEYTLPAQSNPLFIHVASRLANQAYYETHLNTFDCPVTQSLDRPDGREAASRASAANLSVFPNPIPGGTLFADLSDWAGQPVQVRILDTRGRSVLDQSFAGAKNTAIELPGGLSTGIYFLEVVSAEGARHTVRFAVQY